MNHVAVFLEHVDLLNRLDRLDIKLFERRLKLFVVGTCGFMDLFRLSPWGSLAADFGMLLAIGDNGARERRRTGGWGENEPSRGREQDGEKKRAYPKIRILVLAIDFGAVGRQERHVEQEKQLQRQIHRDSPVRTDCCSFASFA